MDTLTLLNPLGPGATFNFNPPSGGWGLPGLPPLASTRLTSGDSTLTNPWFAESPWQSPMLPNVAQANEAATQALLIQVLGLLIRLVQNQNQNQNSSANQAGGGSGGDLGGGGNSSGGASGASGIGGGGGGSSTGGNPNVGSGESASGKLVERQGAKIDASIADNFDAMVAAAKKDGVDLKIGSGWRSRQQQEVLYQKYLNGTGNLAAKPGTSNHESGLAIDFENTSGAFEWLKKNATRFGLKNLPGEPWHYSTNGR